MVRRLPGWLWLALILPRLVLFGLFLAHPDVAIKTDSRQYLTLSKNMATCHFYSSQSSPPWTPDTIRTPGYPVFLTFFQIFFQNPVSWVIGAQLLIGLWTCVQLYGWVRERASEMAAASAALILGCDWVILAHTPMILTETLFLYFFTNAITSTWEAMQESPEACARAGLYWGLAMIVRPVVMYLPFLLLPLWFTRKKWGLIFILCAYFLPGLWVVRNYHVARFPGYTSIDGVALLGYPAAGAEAIYQGKPIDQIRVELQRKAEATLSVNATDTDRRIAYRKIADEIIHQRPVELFRYCLHGAVRIMLGTGIEMMTDWLGLAPPPVATGGESALIKASGTRQILHAYPLLWILFITYGLVLLAIYLISVEGLVSLWITRSKTPALLLLGSLLYIVAISAHQGYYRFRIPIMPLLAIACAARFSPIRDKRNV